MTLLLGYLTPETAAGIRPDIDDVGALLTARTVDNNGAELGTFTGATRPTNLQVDKLIDLAVADIGSRIGTDVPDTYWPEALRLAALQAAALVESSYFPSEIDTDRSAYRQYTAMYLDGIQRLVARLQFPGALQGI